MDQDGDMVSINSNCLLSSSTVYMGIQCISDEPYEVVSTLTCVALLRKDRDTRLAQWRKLSLHGAIRCPVYTAPSFPASSSFCILGPICIPPSSCVAESLVLPAVLSSVFPLCRILDSVCMPPPSCDAESLVLPSVLSFAYGSDPLVNCAPVPCAVSSSDFMLITKPPCPLLRSMNFCFQFCVLIPFLVLLLCVNTTMAMPTFVQSELMVCALNANGLMSPVKLAIISPLLMKLAPLFFALSETKTWTNTASNLQVSNYEVFEEKAVPCALPSTLEK